VVVDHFTPDRLCLSYILEIDKWRLNRIVQLIPVPNRFVTNQDEQPEHKIRSGPCLRIQETYSPSHAENCLVLPHLYRAFEFGVNPQPVCLLVFFRTFFRFYQHLRRLLGNNMGMTCQTIFVNLITGSRMIITLF